MAGVSVVATEAFAEGAKLSRSEARRLKDEEAAARVDSIGQAWRLGGKTVVKEKEVVEDVQETLKREEARARSRSRERKEVLDRLAKISNVKEKETAQSAAEGETAAEPEKKLSKMEEAKALMAKEKEKARIKKQQQEEAKKAEEMKKKMAKLDKELSGKPKEKRYGFKK